MSQDIREYDLPEVDGIEYEATNLAVTAAVGPTPDGVESSRGAQITLSSRHGTVYGRMTEPQIRDLIAVLQDRINPDRGLEATGQDSDNKTTKPDGRLVKPYLTEEYDE